MLGLFLFIHKAISALLYQCHIAFPNLINKPEHIFRRNLRAMKADQVIINNSVNYNDSPLSSLNITDITDLLLNWA
jgi:hypothetical protein